MIMADKNGDARETNATLLCYKSWIGRVVSSHSGTSVLPRGFRCDLVTRSSNQRTLVVTVVVAQLWCELLCYKRPVFKWTARMNSPTANVLQAIILI